MTKPLDLTKVLVSNDIGLWDNLGKIFVEFKGWFYFGLWTAHIISKSISFIQMPKMGNIIPPDSHKGREIKGKDHYRSYFLNGFDSFISKFLRTEEFFSLSNDMYLPRIWQ